MSEYPIRRAFIPRDGYTFYMLDYDQMEMRMMFDLAGEYSVIDLIKKGFDPHKATAYTMFKLTDETYEKKYRNAAKAINFGLIYGMGVSKLATTLGVEYNEALDLKEQYFRNLPATARFIKRVTLSAKNSGHIFNWLGREYFFLRDEAYKAVNYLIQGGCADIVKIAMVRTHNRLKDHSSRLILQIHDELIFEVADGEEYLVAQLKEIMEGVYPFRSLPMTCGVDKSNKSWHDKEPVDVSIT